MLQWIGANLGTVLICLFLATVVALAVWYLVRQKRSGRSSCGCSCAHCAMCGSCHQKKQG